MTWTGEPCVWRGCQNQATEPVVTNWRVYDVEPTNRPLVIVTIQGWIDVNCRPHAIERVLWPPHPKEEAA